MITITSGKGGVGKTGLSVNLAIDLAKRGFKTCVFDADLGLANINILLNLYPKYNLADVISKKKTLEEILIRNTYGIDIIPGSSGVDRMADLSRDQIHSLIQAFSKLDAYDYIIFDTSAGTSKSVISFCMACKELIIVIIPEPTSLTDAYAVLKVLAANGYKGVPKIVVNQAKSSDGAHKIHEKFSQTVQKYLSIKIEYLGMVLKDPHAPEAVTQQKPALHLFPECGFSRSIMKIGENLVGHAPDKTDSGSLDTFFTRYVRFLNQPLTRFREEKEPLTRSIEKQAETDSQTERQAFTPPTIPEIKAAEETPDKPETIDPSSLDIKSMLARLIDTMSSVSGEIKALRMVAQTQMSGGNDDNPLSVKEKTTTLPPDTPSDYLDFETYRNERKERE